MRQTTIFLLSLMATLPLAAQTTPEFSTLSNLPGGGGGAPLIVSNNPESVSREGLLFSTNQMTPANSGTIRRNLSAEYREGTCPAGSMRNFSFYMHHFNQSLGAGARFYVVLEPAQANTSVRYAITGAAISEGDTGSLAIGRSPSYKVVESLALRRLAPGVGTGSGSMYVDADNRLISANTSVAIANLVAEPNKSVDARLGIAAEGCVRLRVIAATARNGTVASAVALGRLAYAYGNIPTTSSTVGGVPCSDSQRIGWGRPAGVYRYEDWNTEVNTLINSTSSRQGWKFLSAPPNRFTQSAGQPAGVGVCSPNTAVDSHAQRSPALSYYSSNTDPLALGRDSDPNSTSQYGVRYRMAISARNNSGSCVIARLQLSPYPGRQICANVPLTSSSPSRNFDGTFRVSRNGDVATVKQVTARCPAVNGVPAVAEISAVTLAAGATMRWDLETHIPGLISAPAGLLLTSEPCR